MLTPLSAITLSGRHVRLVPLSLDHVDALVTAASQDRVSYRFTFVPDDAPAMKRYVEQALCDQEAGLALPFTTLSISDGSESIVGTTRFGNIERWPPPRGPSGETSGETGVSAVPTVAEIGWTWLAPVAQHTAINTEAKLLMLGHAFDTWRVERVSLCTDARNQRSRAAIERLGAVFDGVLRAHMPASDGTVRDSAFYSIVTHEWPRIRERLEARLR